MDRCASAWLIKRFIDGEAEFYFASEDDMIPDDMIAFTLPRARIKPVEGKMTTYDRLIEEYGISDPLALTIGKYIHDFEIDARENPARLKQRETLGLVYVLKGLEKISETDHEILDRAFIIIDAFLAS